MLGVVEVAFGLLLAQHPSIAYSNEIYSPASSSWLSSLPPIDSVLEKVEQGISGSELHLFEVKHLPDQNIGLYPQLDVRDWLNLFFVKGYKYHLLMRRCNGLRRIVSHFRAAESGQYVLGSYSQAFNNVPITIPLEGIVHGFGTRTLLGWLEEYERGHQVMQDCLGAMAQLHSQFTWHELVYEDHIEHDPLMAYRVYASDLPSVDVDLRYRKISPGRLVDLIANFDEVRDCLSPTRFAWMLSE